MSYEPSREPRWLLAALAGASSAHALDPARPMALYQRESWGAEHGFPGGGVHAITQGKDGYLWLGTERGLVRFDGTEFRLVPGQEAVSAGGPDILGVVVDASGSLWLRPDRPALLRRRDSGFESVPFATDPREVAVTAMTLGRSGELLVYAQVSGLMAWRGERFERIGLEPNPSSIVLSMAETPDGTLFLGTRDSGLFRLRDGRIAPLLEGLPDRKVNCLLAVSERDVWVGTDRGIVRWNGSALTTDGVPQALRGAQALALVRDRDQNVWVGTSAGLLRANAHGAAELEARPPSRGGAVTAIFEDREGDLWLGGGSGIERLHDTPFTTYSRAHGLPSDGVGAIHVDRVDRVWFSPPEGGLYRLENERVERVAAFGLENDRVYSIAAARDGLWIGRQRGGLTHLRFEGRTLARAQLHRGRRAQPIERLRRARKPRRERLGGHAQRRALPPARGSHRDLHDRRWLAFQQRQRARRDCRRHVVGGHAPGSRRAVGRGLDHAPHRGRAALGQRERARRGLARRALDRHGRRPRVPALRARRGARPARPRRCARRSWAWVRARAAGSGSPPRGA